MLIIGRKLQRTRLKKSRPRVHMDYFFMSREDESASSNPLFVMADEKSGARYARAVG